MHELPAFQLSVLKWDEAGKCKHMLGVCTSMTSLHCNICVVDRTKMVGNMLILKEKSAGNVDT